MYLILVKKIQISSIYQPDNWYKSDKSRVYILSLVYAPQSFLPFKPHQPHEKEFMVHLETIAWKKPEYARDCGIVLFPEKSVLSNNLLMFC